MLLPWPLPCCGDNPFHIYGWALGSALARERLYIAACTVYEPPRMALQGGSGTVARDRPPEDAARASVAFIKTQDKICYPLDSSDVNRKYSAAKRSFQCSDLVLSEWRFPWREEAIERLPSVRSGISHIDKIYVEYNTRDYAHGSSWVVFCCVFCVLLCFLLTDFTHIRQGIYSLRRHRLIGIGFRL